MEFNKSGTNSICIESAFKNTHCEVIVNIWILKKHSSKTRGTLQLQRVKKQEPFISEHKNLIFDVNTPK